MEDRMVEESTEKQTHLSVNYIKGEDILRACEQELQEQVFYYMKLADYALAKPTVQGQHDALCRLLVKIAGEYPYDIAQNPGDVLLFPKVKILDPEDLCYGEEVELEYRVFESMFHNEDDYRACTGIRGGHIYFLTLSLWYEACVRRDQMRLDGECYKNFEREIESAIDAAFEKERLEAEARAERKRNPFGRERLPHFEVEATDKELLAILHGLKAVEWRYNRVKQVGLVEDDISDDEWLAALKGPADSRPAARRRLPWRAKYACKSFVVQYLGSDYEKAEKVFCLSGDMEIKNLIHTNIYRNKDICDLREGKIAIILKEAKKIAG